MDRIPLHWGAMLDLNALSLQDLFVHLIRDGSLERLLRAAREEDLAGLGDVTTASMIGMERPAEGELAAREEGVIAGLAVIPPLLRSFDVTLTFEPTARDGEPCPAGQALGRLAGSLAEMLLIERTLLNILGRLSGIASLTRRYVEAVGPSKAAICETRKTTPGLRGLEKYAVRCGGGTLHRLGLWDAALYKDNHLAHVPPDELAASLEEAIRAARTAGELRFVEIEVDTLQQLGRVLTIERGLVDIVLLDNMSPEDLRQAVALRDAQAPEMLLEASGGVTLETVAGIASTGVDRISVGALTHSAASLDIGLDVR
ncbi:MAG: carboxylating nicotinate-nucleotide diphosphorylase [Planctomycetota bacterium]|nr:carboxylating nicotinate-nucleotide diphosphorylase [Planctomycetota bacterium]